MSDPKIDLHRELHGKVKGWLAAVRSMRIDAKILMARADDLETRAWELERVVDTIPTGSEIVEVRDAD